jgi:hypothetical protein
VSALEPAPGFDDDNAFLLVTLGLAAGARAVLDAAGAVTAAGDGGAAVADDDPVLLAALGAIRLAAKALAVLEGWRVEAPEDAVAAADAPVGDLLR